MGGRAAELFGVDLRSLAAFRIAVSAVVLVDLVRRAGDFTAFYTEAGVLPLGVLRLLDPRAGWLSLHAALGSSALAVAGLFALAGCAALALAVGWQTRAATVLSWLLLTSLQRREPWLALTGGDHLLRLLLFWGMFLPLDARWSVAAARNPALRAAPAQHVSVATAALLGQIALVYFATGAQKVGSLWDDGSALRYALDVDPMVTGFGVWLREHGGPLLPWATHGTVWFERLGPLLAFSPVATGPLRTLAVALFLGFHLALAAALDVGLFPIVCMAAWLAFLPAWFWDVALRRPEPAPPAAVAAARLAPARLVQGLVAAVFALVCVDVAAAASFQPDPFPRPLRSAFSALRLGQTWSMFSPNPPTVDAWIERVGQTAAGRRLDLARGGPAEAEKPARLSALDSNSWRFWFGHLQALPRDAPVRGPALERLAEFSCDEWNARALPEQRFASIEIAKVTERTLPVGTAPLLREVLLRRPCPTASDGGAP